VTRNGSGRISVPKVNPKVKTAQTSLSAWKGRKKGQLIGVEPLFGAGVRKICHGCNIFHVE